MTALGSIKVAVYSAFAALSMLAGLVLGRPEFAALATPFVAATALAVLSRARPDLSCTVELVSGRLLEGEDAAIKLHLVPHTSGKLLQRASSVVLLSVEAAVYDDLDPRTQGFCIVFTNYLRARAPWRLVHLSNAIAAAFL